MIENGGQGNDTVFTSVSWVMTPGSDIELLATVGEVVTTDINLTGNANGNVDTRQFREQYNQRRRRPRRAHRSGRPGPVPVRHAAQCRHQCRPHHRLQSGDRHHPARSGHLLELARARQHLGGRAGVRHGRAGRQRPHHLRPQHRRPVLRQRRRGRKRAGPVRDTGRDQRHETLPDQPRLPGGGVSGTKRHSRAYRVRECARSPGCDSRRRLRG